MHEAQQDFCRRVRDRFPRLFRGARVFDVGSLDVNGTNRPLFDDCEYTGIDLGPGPGVDVVGLAHEHDAPDGHYDVVISTNALEHDKHWRRSLRNMLRVLRANGLFVLSVTRSWAEHGTRRTSPGSSPFTSKRPGWEDYYRNLNEADVRAAIHVDDAFAAHEFEAWNDDLYFWGVKNPM